MNAQTGIINIRGKEYQTVALRVKTFRDSFPQFALTTAIIDRDDECVVVQASIADDKGFVLATGHAEEYRAATQINKTSALENAETSAIGRALAAFGFGGTEFATANEVANAIHQQNSPEPVKKKDMPFPAGPCKNITTLKADARAIWNDILAVTDSASLDNVLDAGKPVIDQMKAALPSWWTGGYRGEESFEGMEAAIERRRSDIRAIESAPNAFTGG